MDDSGKATLRRMFKAIEAVRLVDESLPIQTLAAFLSVALEEGQSINEVGKSVGIAQSSASRNLSILGDINYKKKPGLKLTEYRQNISNFSTKEVYLTTKGRALLDNIIATLQTGGTTHGHS